MLDKKSDTNVSIAEKSETVNPQKRIGAGSLGREYAPS